MGRQSRRTIETLAGALAEALGSRPALLVASTDLSHYFDGATAGKLDGEACDAIAAFDPERLLEVFERYPEDERGRYVGCGIGRGNRGDDGRARALGACVSRPALRAFG